MFACASCCYWYNHIEAKLVISLLFKILSVSAVALFKLCAFFTVLIDSGSRYEVSYPSGITHFLEKLAFGVSLYFAFIGSSGSDGSTQTEKFRLISIDILSVSTAIRLFVARMLGWLNLFI